MSKSLDVDELLRAKPSTAVAKKPIEWVAETRNGIARGDMMLGILSIGQVEKIPAAYQAAARYGELNAWIDMAWWYAAPQIGEQNLELAEAAIQEAIHANVPNAPLECVKIRWFFKRDTATTKEKQEAYQIASRMVESDRNHAEAIYFLALLITHGFGVAASPEAGFKLQQQSADLGNTNAMFELYVHHVHGLGVAADEKAAIAACRRAAEAGHSRAMYSYGAYNASGRGMPKNIPEAIQWYERAAQDNNPSAMAGLALIYATGDGVEPDREYARQLFDQADYCGLDVSALREQVGL